MYRESSVAYQWQIIIAAFRIGIIWSCETFSDLPLCSRDSIHMTVPVQTVFRFDLAV